MKKIHIIIIGEGGQKVNKDNINISVIIRVSNEEENNSKVTPSL